MDKRKKILNELLVQIFNDILQIEEQSLKQGVINDLSVTEIHTIDAIGMYTERTMSEVAQDLKITVGTLTTAINKLIKKGYVERKRIEEDRRVVLVSLTEIGKKVFDVHSVFHKEMIDGILENFKGDELDVLTKALGKANRFFERKYESLN